MESKERNVLLWIVLAGIVNLLQSYTLAVTVEQQNDKFIVSPLAPIKVYSFSLKQVRLLDGPFRHAQELDHQYLLSLDADRLLHNFRVNAGLPSSAQPLGGWEDPNGELRGHSVGHYLSACAMMYVSTGDLQLKERANYIVAELAKCQDKIGTGYLSAFPEEFFDRVETGKKVWAPWYTLHKIYAGLVDMYLLCDNRQALEVVLKMADWAKARTDKLSEEQMQKMLGTEHGGMNDVLAEIYAITGDQKYITLAERFNHKAVLDPLSRQEDRLQGLHANTQIPKITGCARQYELTKNPYFKTIAEFFWRTVIDNHTYVIGGNSDGEHFGPKGKLAHRLSRNTTETCNTYNMLKLTRHLFSWQPKTEYADYYERALYNHILASQDPESGMVCYYVPLQQGTIKTYSKPLDSFWCCVGTGIENHARYGESIYFHSEDDLYVNLFIASQLTWPQKGLVMRQETKFPLEDKTTLVLKCDKGVKAAIHIRYPSWATNGITIKINDKRQTVRDKPGSFIKLQKTTWENGDTIEVTLPMSLHTESMPDDKKKIAILYGPVVLAGDLGPQAPAPRVPVLITDGKDVSEWAKPVESGKLRFQTVGAGKPNDFTLIPFYQMHHQHYSVYFDVLTNEQWEQRQAENQAKQK
jgi:DUF1680 family protein